MKKIFTLMLGIALFCSIATVSARTYLVELGTPSAATWRTLGVSDSLYTTVNLSTAGAAGASVSLNAWFVDKSLATPTFAGAAFVSGDKLYLTKGTYTLTGTIVLKAGVSIFGGFVGTETVSAARAKSSTLAWDFTNATTIDGANTYIAFAGGSGTTTLVDGLTIQNCLNSATSGSGGAAKLYGSNTSIQNSIITACSASLSTTGASGAVVLTAGSYLKNCYIHHNTNSTAGAVTIYGNACKVTGCKFEYNTATTGNSGALQFYSATSGTSVSDCSFSNNSAVGSGGAIGAFVSNTVNTLPISITNCTFNSNTASSGGAIQLSFSGTKVDSTYIVSGCTFTANTATASTASSTAGGGAVYMSTGKLLMDNCTFTNNSTTVSSGGALLCYVSTTTGTISNCKFIGNTAGTITPYGGSAIYSKAALTVNNCLMAGNTGGTIVHFYAATAASTFQNCTFASNLSSTGTDASFQLLALTPKYAFTNCLFYKNSTFSGQTPTSLNCGFDVAIPGYSTNCITGITADAFKDAANGDYSLSATSVAIDKGTNLAAATSPVTTDILGAARPAGTAFDMGAYEFGGVIATVNNVANNEVKSISVIKNAVVSNVEGSLQVIDFKGCVLSTTPVEVGTVVTIPSGAYIIKVQSKAGVSVQKVVL